MHILAAFAFIISVAAFPANYPDSPNLSPHLDEGDLETLEQQAPEDARLMSLLLARDAGFSTDVEDTDLSAAPVRPRNSRSPYHWYKKPQSTEHYYKPQHYGDSHQYKPQHQGDYHHDSYQHYKPAHYYKPAHHYKPHGRYY